jgi:hypothetical protein
MSKPHNGHPSPKRIGAVRITSKISGLRVWSWNGSEYRTAREVWEAATQLEHKTVK